MREWCQASKKPWGSAPPYGPASVTKHRKAEDAFVGLIAIGARLAVSSWRLSGLETDGFGRLAWMQIVASVLSLVHAEPHST